MKKRASVKASATSFFHAFWELDILVMDRSSSSKASGVCVGNSLERMPGPITLPEIVVAAEITRSWSIKTFLRTGTMERRIRRISSVEVWESLVVLVVLVVVVIESLSDVGSSAAVITTGRTVNIAVKRRRNRSCI